METLDLFSSICLLIMSACSTGSHSSAKNEIVVLNRETPFEQVLNIEKSLSRDLQNVVIRQSLNKFEAPTLSKIVVEKPSLSDEKIHSIRKTYSFKQSGGEWKLVDTIEEYSCKNAKDSAQFQKEKCE